MNKETDLECDLKEEPLSIIRIVLGLSIMVALIIGIGYPLKSSQDKERYKELKPYFTGDSVENKVLANEWLDVSSDEQVSMIEVNKLACSFNEKLCLSWFKLYLPLPGDNGALNAMMDVKFLKKVLKHN